MATVNPEQVTRTQWGKITRDPEETRFLEGPHPRLEELRRVIRISAEFIQGFRALHWVGPCVTIFGSARFQEDHPYYRLTRNVASAVGSEGFTIMTGGGPGLMEAANRGARDVKAPSVGCNIRLPREQSPNPYLDKFVEFRYFFVRKVMLAKYSYAFVAMPGGFGTMDELFEIATLAQTRKIRGFPIVLMGRAYWKPLLDFVSGPMISQKTIDPQDAGRFVVTDSPAEAARIVREAAERFGLKFQPPRPSKALLE